MELIPPIELHRLASQLTAAELAGVRDELLAHPECGPALLNYLALSSPAARVEHTATLLLNRYYWLAKFAKAHHAHFGFDAGIAQQLHQLLESADGEIDGSVIEKIHRELITIEFPSTLNAAWLGEEPLQLGSVPPHKPTADSFVTAEFADGSRLRIDLYRGAAECHAFEGAIVWHNYLAIGWGSQVYFVDPTTRTAKRVGCDDYFGHLYPTGELLLIASCLGLVAVDANAEVIWRSEMLGIDGVLVDRVEGDTIFGQGEWDPPGGWQPFQLHLQTGQKC